MAAIRGKDTRPEMILRRGLHPRGFRFRLPATRQEFWRAKIEGNAARDKDAEAALLADGWRVLTIWECALKRRGRLPAEMVLDRAAEWLVNGPAHEAIAGGAYGGI